MGATCALCCEGRVGAVQGPADRDAFLCRVVTVRWSGHRGDVLARIWLPGLSIRWVGRLWCGTKLSCPVLGDAEGLGACLVENRSC